MRMLLTQTKTVAYYMTDPSFRQGEHPTTYKTTTVFTTTKIWSWVPEGLNAKTDWLTDRPTVSCKVTLISSSAVDYSLCKEFKRMAL
jgi:hypothetical protein